MTTDEIFALRERLLIDPQNIGTMQELAALLEAGGDIPGAIDLYQRALRIDPYETAMMLRLAGAWAALSDAGQSRRWLTRALSIDPDCAEAARLLSALDGDDRLTAAYVRTLFDQYADRFDAELMHTLHYQAPRLVADALRRCGVDGADILDLGCGTGLSGEALRPFARRLDGVDLSPRMVERAQARGIYDSLSVDDAEAYLRRADRRWQIIAAVDMLNYVGDLGPLFGLAARCLDQGGLLVGTVEKAADGGVALTAKRRYVHGADHVRAAARSAGLDLCDLVEGTLRTEARSEVAGLIFVVRAPPNGGG